MAYNLVRLYKITQKEEYRELLEKQMEFMSKKANDYPSGSSMFLIAKLLYENDLEHITIALKEKDDLDKIINKLPLMADVSVVKDDINYPLLNDKTTFYICKNHNCLPATNEMNF